MSTPGRNTLPAARGFTLVELQIALLLVSLIAVVMVAVLRLSSQTWHKVTIRQDIAEHRFLVTQTLRRHLANMRFLRVGTEDGGVITGFLGTQEQFTYIAPFPTFENDGELYWWTLQSVWNNDERAYQMVLDYQPFVPGLPVILLPDGNLEIEDQEPDRLVVADHMRIEEVRYYRRDRDGQEEWLDEWEPANESPLVVSLQLQEVDAEENLFSLPELAVAPRFASQLFYADDGSDDDR